MKHAQLLCCVAAFALACACGCRTQGPSLVSGRLDDEGEDEDVRADPFDSDAMDRVWKETEFTTRVRKQERGIFVRASKARKAPRLLVTCQDGSKARLRPGLKGRITLVLFWSMDVPLPAEAARNLGAWIAEDPVNAPTTAAAKHIRDLAAKYARMGVRAVGIVERTHFFDSRGKKRPTNSHKLAPAFVRAKNINYPIYYDDFTALATMARAAGAPRKGRLPCVFILDRDQRVRVARRGFQYASGIAIPRDEQTGRERPAEAEEVISDTAPPDERIEHYLTLLLNE